MRVLQTILCVVTVLLLEVTCHPTLDDRSLPEVPNLLDTTDNLYNPHANHDNPALVPRVEPGKPLIQPPTTTPSEPTDPAARNKIEIDPEVTKKIPLLPLPAAFPPSNAPVSCPRPAAGGAPAAAPSPPKNAVTKRTPEKDQATLLQKNENFQKALEAENALIRLINKHIDAKNKLDKEEANMKTVKSWTSQQSSDHHNKAIALIQEIRSNKELYFTAQETRIKASAIVVTCICLLDKKSKQSSRVKKITGALGYYTALAKAQSLNPDAPRLKEPKKLE